LTNLQSVVKTFIVRRIVKINQEKNFRAEFGSIYRSSSIFYLPKNIKTTISISNYWKFKNNKDISILITERKMSGKLVKRSELNFSKTNVINLSNFSISEGSVEIEAFANSNIKIPYAAVMSVYDAKNSVSMVHTYSRNHSNIELEDKNCILKGRESCWTIKPKFKNFAIFHNGHLDVKKQKAKLILTNKKNKDKTILFKIPKLNPYETYKFDLKKICPLFKEHLLDSEGFATLHFENNSSFTRLLIIWSDESNKNFQVTHSNFDYSKLITNKIFSKKGAEMPLVHFKNKLEVKQLIIYPKFEKNIFFLKLDKKYNKEKIEYGKIFDISNDKSRAIFFTNNNTLPSRLVTALSGKSKNQKIPFECSMGVVHENTAKKRFSWSLVSSKYKTFIHINFNTILNPQKKFSICFKIYNSENLNILKKNIFFSGKENIKDPLVYELRNIFPNYIKFLKNDYGYISIFSHNTSARMFTSLQSIRKGTTLEHAF
jgi:hypothetical protein